MHLLNKGILFYKIHPIRILVTTALMIFVGYCFVSCTQRTKEFSDLVRSGAVDLSSIDFNDYTLIRLNGPWRFWEGELLTPDEVTARLKAGNSAQMNVPGYWSTLGLFDDTFKLSKGGTLALEVSLPAKGHEWGIRLPDAMSACRLYANDRLLASIGTVSFDSAAYLPATRIESPIFYTADKKLLLVMNVANFSIHSTGTWDSPLFGTAVAIQKKQRGNIITACLTSGAMIFMGLYHLALFLLRRKDKSTLVFSIICMFMAMRNLMMGERVLSALFPPTLLGWHTAYVVERLSVHMCVALFFIFFALVFPKEMKKIPLYISIVVCSLWAILEIFTPTLFADRFISIFEGFVLVACVYALFVNILAVIQRREGAMIILLGIMILVATAVNDVLFSNKMIKSMYLTSIGMFVFTFFQSLFLSKRNANLFSSVERYVSKLERINNSLDRFIPHEMLDYLGKDGIDDIQLGNFAEAQMTVFFLDLRNFTARSETMSPAETFAFLNSFLGRFGPIVRAYAGVIDKYLGDGFMALFPGDPDDALRAALHMRGELAQFNTEIAEEGQEALRFGIGIHTGPLMLGTIGESLRMDTTVISDTVNTASRLEQLNKQFDTDILFSDETRAALVAPSSFDLRALANETVRGKLRTVRVFTLDPGTNY